VHSAAQEREKAGEDVIILTVGDPDFDTPPIITERAVESLYAGDTHYVATGGIAELRKAIAETESRRLGRAIRPNQVVTTPGAQCALYGAMRCLVEPGDEVIVFEPAYVTFQGVVAATGADLVGLPLKQDGDDFSLDVAGLEAAITPRTRVVLVNFPHNPSGALLSRNDWDELCRIALAHDLWLISDEVYADICYEGEFISPLARQDMAAHCLVARSLSKSHAMSGWRVGWLLAPEDLVFHMQNLLNSMLFGNPHFIQKAAVAALTAQIPEVAEMKAAYRRRRDLLVRGLAPATGLHFIPPASGLFCLLDVSATGLDDMEFANRLLEEQGVSVLPCGSFGRQLAGYVRLSLCQAEERLADACRRIVRFAASLQ
jgi:arginine:pyruvate transaminase